MHPAFSVLFLTTFIGIGQGLFLAIYTTWVYTLAGLLPAQNSHDFYIIGSLVALMWLGAGLFASFFHLGHPERAWRAITRWRTSWLAREVIVLPVFMAAVAAYGMAYWCDVGSWHFLSGSLSVDSALLVGSLATSLTFLLFLCTGMVYADVHLLAEWHHWLTVLNFILMGTASGFTLATVLANWLAPSLANFCAFWAVLLILAATITRSSALIRNHYLKRRYSLRTAIGVRHHQIAQIAQGAMGGSFNTREFFHGCSPHFMHGIRNVYLILAFLMPLTLVVAAWWYLNARLAALAFCIQILGMLSERWYFFAQVRHPQNLYYQSVA